MILWKISSDKIFRHLYIMVEGFCLVLNYSSKRFRVPQHHCSLRTHKESFVFNKSWMVWCGLYSKTIRDSRKQNSICRKETGWGCKIQPNQKNKTSEVELCRLQESPFTPQCISQWRPPQSETITCYQDKSIVLTCPTMVFCLHCQWAMGFYGGNSIFQMDPCISGTNLIIF